MRYVIIGAGAVGLSLAAEFERAGIDYLAIGRGRQLERLQSHGLDYERPEGRRIVRLNVSDLEHAAPLRRDDVLFLAVKTQDVEAVAAQLAGLPVEGGGIAADLPVVTLQNGLAAERIVARRFARVYGAVVLVPAVHLEPGKVTVLSAPQLASVSIGRFPHGRDELSARIAADLARADSLAEEREDIQRWKAAKLLHNVKNVLELFSGDAGALARAAQEIEAEARRVLLAAGYDPARPQERRVDISGWKVLRQEGSTGQSTWQSFQRGSSSEVDWLNGEIAQLALLHDVPAPWNRAAQRLAAELSRTRGAPGSIDIASLAEAAGARPAGAQTNNAA